MYNSFFLFVFIFFLYEYKRDYFDILKNYMFTSINYIFNIIYNIINNSNNNSLKHDFVTNNQNENILTIIDNSFPVNFGSDEKLYQNIFSNNDIWLDYKAINNVKNSQKEPITPVFPTNTNKPTTIVSPSSTSTA